MTELPTPACSYGFTRSQLTELLGENEAAFWSYMTGQTMTYCEGRLWSSDDEMYYPACGGVAHGPVVYTCDLKRFLAGLPPLD